MSTIKTTTLSTADGVYSVPIDTLARGACRAWVNFNGTGTVAIQAQFNVSSITDNGVGNYTVNFTIAMPDNKYSCVGGVRVAGSTVDGVSANASAFELTSLSVSSVGVGAFNYNNIAVDRDNFTCSVFR